MSITGSLQLSGGILDLVLGDEWTTADVGTSFDIFSAGDVSGSFANLSWTSEKMPDNGLAWVYGFDSITGIGSVTLTESGGVPEPATWIMLLVGGGILAAAGRRNRKR